MIMITAMLIMMIMIMMIIVIKAMISCEFGLYRALLLDIPAECTGH
jgi:hypothetical protein